jgi:hypothetical protein
MIRAKSLYRLRRSLIKCYKNIKNGSLKMQEKNFKTRQFDSRLPKLERALLFFSRKNNFCLLFSVNELN